jgi:hypothetical protein
VSRGAEHSDARKACVRGRGSEASQVTGARYQDKSVCNNYQGVDESVVDDVSSGMLKHLFDTDRQTCDRIDDESAGMSVRHVSETDRQTFNFGVDKGVGSHHVGVVTRVDLDRQTRAHGHGGDLDRQTRAHGHGGDLDRQTRAHGHGGDLDRQTRTHSRKINMTHTDISDTKMKRQVMDTACQNSRASSRSQDALAYWGTAGRRSKEVTIPVHSLDQPARVCLSDGTIRSNTNNAIQRSVQAHEDEKTFYKSLRCDVCQQTSKQWVAMTPSFLEAYNFPDRGCDWSALAGMLLCAACKNQYQARGSVGILRRQRFDRKYQVSGLQKRVRDAEIQGVGLRNRECDKENHSFYGRNREFDKDNQGSDGRSRECDKENHSFDGRIPGFEGEHRDTCNGVPSAACGIYTCDHARIARIRCANDACEYVPKGFMYVLEGKAGVGVYAGRMLCYSCYKAFKKRICIDDEVRVTQRAHGSNDASISQGKALVKGQRRYVRSNVDGQSVCVSRDCNSGIHSDNGLDTDGEFRYTHSDYNLGIRSHVRHFSVDVNPVDGAGLGKTTCKLSCDAEFAGEMKSMTAKTHGSEGYGIDGSGQKETWNEVPAAGCDPCGYVDAVLRKQRRRVEFEEGDGVDGAGQMRAMEGKRRKLVGQAHEVDVVREEYPGIRDCYGEGSGDKRRVGLSLQREGSDGRRRDGLSDGRRRDGLSDGRRRDGLSDGRRGDGLSDGRRGDGLSDGRRRDGMSDGRRGDGLSDGRRGDGLSDGKRDDHTERNEDGSFSSGEGSHIHVLKKAKKTPAADHSVEFGDYRQSYGKSYGKSAVVVGINHNPNINQRGARDMLGWTYNGRHAANEAVSGDGDVGGLCMHTSPKNHKHPRSVQTQIQDGYVRSNNSQTASYVTGNGHGIFDHCANSGQKVATSSNLQRRTREITTGQSVATASTWQEQNRHKIDQRLEEQNRLKFKERLEKEKLQVGLAMERAKPENWREPADTFAGR